MRSAVTTHYTDGGFILSGRSDPFPDQPPRLIPTNVGLPVSLPVTYPTRSYYTVGGNL